jgi:ribonuclease Z
MDLELCFLGTAAAVPTPDRSLSATFMRRGGDKFLFDCGEGTQRQLIRFGVGYNQIDTIFFTHYHADHCFGLPGLLKTWELWGRETPLTLYGPVGLQQLLNNFKPLMGNLAFELNLIEWSPGDRLPLEDGYIQAIQTQHRVPSLGYALVESPRPGVFSPEKARGLGIQPGPDFGLLQKGISVGEVTPDQVLGPSRPGRKVVLSGDTRPVKSIQEIALDADVLVHEATFSNTEQERAIFTNHSTVAEAANLARDAQVKNLILTHLSSRVLVKQLRAEIADIYPQAIFARDLDSLLIPYADKGEVELIPFKLPGNR